MFHGLEAILDRSTDTSFQIVDSCRDGTSNSCCTRCVVAATRDFGDGNCIFIDFEDSIPFTGNSRQMSIYGQFICRVNPISCMLYSHPARSHRSKLPSPIGRQRDRQLKRSQPNATSATADSLHLDVKRGDVAGRHAAQKVGKAYVGNGVEHGRRAGASEQRCHPAMQYKLLRTIDQLSGKQSVFGPLDTTQLKC